MASTLLSPGVLARENDSSQVRQQPVVVGAAIIGPTPKGPVEIPTVVTSYSDYVSKFGDVESITSASITTNYSYFTGMNFAKEKIIVRDIFNKIIHELASD